MRVCAWRRVFLWGTSIVQRRKRGKGNSKGLIIKVAGVQM